MALRTDAAHTPSKSKSRSADSADRSPYIRIDPMPTVEGSDEEYLDEDDFEAFEEPTGSITVDTKTKLPQSPITVPVDDDDQGDLDDALLAEDDVEDDDQDGNTDMAEADEELDVEGMTLDAYIQIYAKRATKAKDMDDDLVTGDTVDASPEAVDPQVRL